MLIKNFRTLMNEEIPKITQFFNEVSMISEMNDEMKKCLDRYSFVLAMLGSTSIFDLVHHKLECLKKAITYLCKTKEENYKNLHRFTSSFDPDMLDALCHLSSEQTTVVAS